MKRICAWCNKHLGGDPKSTIITHGICEACSKKMLEEEVEEVEEEESENKADDV